MLDVSSGTRSLPGKNAGRPMTHSAPRIGPDDRAEPADHHDRHEQERVVDREEPVAAARVCSAPASSAPPRPAMPPASANVRSFTRVGLDGVRRRAVGVVAHADRGPADAGPPEPGRDHDHDDERREHDVVVGALRT